MLLIRSEEAANTNCIRGLGLRKGGSMVILGHETDAFS